MEAKKLSALEEILYGKDPEKLLEEPSDWSTNYKTYVTKDSKGDFVSVTGEAAPTFRDGEYYKNGVEPRLPLPDEISTIMAEG